MEVFPLEDEDTVVVQFIAQQPLTVAVTLVQVVQL